MSLRSWTLIAATSCALLGCPDDTPKPSATSASAAASAPATAPASASASAAPVAYRGPTGTLTGTVTVKGDEPPRVEHDYPEGCESAVATYGKLFRVGQDGGVADVVVTVTHYTGFVPPKDEAVPVRIKDCAFDRRVYTLTHGQHLEVKNLDVMRNYVPHLDGARLPADLVAIPRGPAVKLHTRGLGRYFLSDHMGRTFMKADVFHFRFATNDVTGMDGKYRIEGVPVGKAKLGILWPAANMKTLTKDVVVKEGENVVDFELTFDADKDVPDPNAAPPAASATSSATSSAAPSGAPSGAASAAPASTP